VLSRKLIRLGQAGGCLNHIARNVVEVILAVIQGTWGFISSDGESLSPRYQILYQQMSPIHIWYDIWTSCEIDHLLPLNADFYTNLKLVL
jgi:hypothetical protein